MPPKPKPKRNAWKRFYVNTLIVLLPLLLKIGNAVSKKIRSETLYLGDGFTFALDIEGFGRGCLLQQRNNGWKRLPTEAQIPDFIIGFRDLDYAYDVFIGNITLQDALAARLFTTHGPNTAGVSITYMFTVILKAFFGWRSSYRR